MKFGGFFGIRLRVPFLTLAQEKKREREKAEKLKAEQDAEISRLDEIRFLKMWANIRRELEFENSKVKK